MTGVLVVVVAFFQELSTFFRIKQVFFHKLVARISQFQIKQFFSQLSRFLFTNSWHNPTLGTNSCEKKLA